MKKIILSNKMRSLCIASHSSINIYIFSLTSCLFGGRLFWLSYYVSKSTCRCRNYFGVLSHCFVGPFVLGSYTS